MAIFQDNKYLVHANHPVFDAIYKPGDVADHPGIYRCEGCGHEITHNLGDPLPPQNHHQHSTAQGLIRWRLIVWGG